MLETFEGKTFYYNWCRFASEAEKNYISASQPKSSSKNGEKLSVPWGKIFTSVPFLTLAVSHFCNNFGWYEYRPL